MNSRILIIGAGELGQALGGYLGAKGCKISLWDADSSKSTDERPLHEIVSSIDFVFLCVPSWAIRSVLSDMTSALPSTSIIVSFSKGMKNPMGEKQPENCFRKLLPNFQQFVIVGGPMLAAEITAGKNAAAVFASSFGTAAKKVADLFASPVFATEISNDAKSVSLAGVLKNIYALGLGIADGLELDGNAKGWLVARAINESLGIAEVLGADKKIMLGTAGLADFVATGYSPYSRNREVGDEIVKNGNVI